MPETRTAAAPAEDEQLAPGATAIVEAATAEAAIAEVHASHGPGAQIVEARRVLRGGVGGFFAKEHVQLHVAAGSEDDHLARRRPAPRPSSADRDAAPSADRDAAPSADRDAAPSADRDPASAEDVTARATALIAELTGQSAPSEPDDAGERTGSPVDRLLAAAADPDDPTADGPVADDPAADGPVADSPAADDPAGDDPVADGQGRTGQLDADQVDFGTFLRAQLAAEREAVFGTGTSAAPAADAAPADVAEVAPEPPAPGPEPTAWPPSFTEPAAWAPATAAPVDPAPSVGTPVTPAAAPVDAVTTAPVTPAPATPTPAPSPEGPAWSATRLLHLGLPASLVHALDVPDGADDLSWVSALTEALRPLCRPLPAGPSVLLGPDAPAVAEVADTPAARSRTWLAALGTGRWRHLVLGGERWRDDLAEEPLAVSWTRTADLPDALRCATELGLVLGYGPSAGRLVRARPLDVALAIRELVDQR